MRKRISRAALTTRNILAEAKEQADRMDEAKRKVIAERGRKYYDRVNTRPDKIESPTISPSPIHRRRYSGMRDRWEERGYASESASPIGDKEIKLLTEV